MSLPWPKPPLFKDCSNMTGKRESWGNSKDGLIGRRKMNFKWASNSSHTSACKPVNLMTGGCWEISVGNSLKASPILSSHQHTSQGMGRSQSICADSVRAAINNVSLLFLAWSEQCSRDPGAIRAFYHLKGTMCCHGGPNVGYFSNFFRWNDRIPSLFIVNLENYVNDNQNVPG